MHTAPVIVPRYREASESGLASATLACPRVQPALRLDHLRALEAESIHIIREVVAEFERPVMLYSIGKDSSVLLRLAQKAFYPAPIPFPSMSVKLTLEDELDISRGNVLAAGPTEVGGRFDADIVWMDERPLDTGRVYMLKHGSTTVSAEVDRSFSLNEIGTATVSTSRPIVFDSYRADRTTGSFILIDPATNFTAGAGMIVRRVSERDGVGASAAAVGRLARAARTAGSDTEAIEAVRRVLEEILT